MGLAADAVVDRSGEAARSVAEKDADGRVVEDADGEVDVGVAVEVARRQRLRGASDGDYIAADQGAVGGRMVDEDRVLEGSGGHDLVDAVRVAVQVAGDDLTHVTCAAAAPGVPVGLAERTVTVAVQHADGAVGAVRDHDVRMAVAADVADGDRVRLEKQVAQAVPPRVVVRIGLIVHGGRESALAVAEQDARVRLALVGHDDVEVAVTVEVREGRVRRAAVRDIGRGGRVTDTQLLLVGEVQGRE